MNALKLIFRRIVLAFTAILPGHAAPKLLEPEKDPTGEKAVPGDEAVRRARMWNSMFPALTEAQRADPEIQKLMPWNAPKRELGTRSRYAAKMAELTEDRWKPKGDTSGKD